MAVEWPQHLIDRIAAGKWVLFIGSGASAGCANTSGQSPPTWSALLRRLNALVSNDCQREVGEALIDQSQYLDAAGHIRHTLSEENNLNQYLSTLKSAVEGPQGEFYQPSTLHDALLALEPRVVFTTNYEKLFEIASRNAYASYPFDSTRLGSGIRRGDDVLVKLHGSTDSIEQVILTRADYARLMTQGRHVLDCVRALAFTSTILFVGYSLDDPDIQLALQAVGRGSLDPEAHYLLAPAPSSASRLSVFRESYGVTILTYPPGQHDQVEDALQSLAGRVLGARSAAVPQ